MPITTTSTTTTLATKPYGHTLFKCDFETMCPVRDVTPPRPKGGGRWLVLEGPTPSVKTGPDSGHGGKGKYIYYEASNEFKPETIAGSDYI